MRSRMLPARFSGTGPGESFDRAWSAACSKRVVEATRRWRRSLAARSSDEAVQAQLLAVVGDDFVQMYAVDADDGLDAHRRLGVESGGCVHG